MGIKNGWSEAKNNSVKFLNGLEFPTMQICSVEYSILSWKLQRIVLFCNEFSDPAITKWFLKCYKDFSLRHKVIEFPSDEPVLEIKPL